MQEDLVRKNAEFHQEVRETLARLHVRKKETSLSTRHGATFEEALDGVLATEALRAGDVPGRKGRMLCRWVLTG